MTSGEPALIEFIRERIRSGGPVTFAWFMEQALYHPEHGYYSSGRAAIGRRGDYFTSVSVGPLFGRLMAAQFAEMWEALERPNEFSIVEQGAHDGQFARDVLEAARKHYPEFFASLLYQIVEAFPVLQSRQREMLAAFGTKVAWQSSLEQLEPFVGVHFSNELIDSMPVHVVQWTGDEWVEHHVRERGDNLVFEDSPLSRPALAPAVAKIPLPLPAGYETEINLAALDWIASLSRALQRGFVVAADYGFGRDEFYAPHRREGTLRAYARHQLLPSPLEQIGRADITAHAEWTSLMEGARASGLTSNGLCDQHHFLTGLLTGNAGREFESSADAKTKRALQTLLHPGFLGMKFQFLVLAKDASAAALSGLRFARTRV